MSRNRVPGGGDGNRKLLLPHRELFWLHHLRVRLDVLVHADRVHQNSTPRNSVPARPSLSSSAQAPLRTSRLALF
jgi:hypothetical protein